MITLDMICGLRRGEVSAQREFWQECWPAMYAVCVRILGDGFAANEVGVEVMNEFMMKYVHTISCAEAVRTYLQLCAARRATKERVRQSRPVAVDVEKFAAPQGGNLDEQLSYKLLAPRLELCLGKLTPKAQRVIKLRYFGDHTNSDIGQVVGGSKQYIGRLLTNSLNALKKCLDRLMAMSVTAPAESLP